MPRLCALLLTCASLFAQATPDELAQEVLKRFEAGSLDEFVKLVPVGDGKKLIALAIEHKLPRRPGLARVLHQSGDSAVLLLSGYAGGIPNSGDETNVATQFSGLYRAVRRDGTWQIDRRVPLDETGRLLSHRLDVSVEPGQALQIADRIRISTETPYGVVVRLNHRAAIADISWNGSPVEHAFGGGTLWVQTSGTGDLDLRYRMEVEHGPNNTNSGCFLPHAGHVRDQYFWHPFFDFSSANDQADLSLTVRIPREFQVATTLPQRDRIENEQRVVEAQSSFPTSATALFYDRDWIVTRETLSGFRFELFATSDFDPAAASIVDEIRSSSRFFSERFGAPQFGYFSVIQARARGDSGWPHLTNQGLVAGIKGGAFVNSGAAPRAAFAHEVCHAWTRGAGAGANFIREGWATFCEALVLRQRFGSEIEKRFWNVQAERYFRAHDGKYRINDDTMNSGVSYQKGAWVFKMLEGILGEKKFNEVMTRFASESQKSAKTVEEFMTITGQTAFLKPWITELNAPSLSTAINGNSVSITQAGSLFDLPLTVELKTASSVSRQKVRVSERMTVVKAERDIVSIVLDPDRELLLKR